MKLITKAAILLAVCVIYLEVAESCVRKVTINVRCRFRKRRSIDSDVSENPAMTVAGSNINFDWPGRVARSVDEREDSLVDYDRVDYLHFKLMDAAANKTEELTVEEIEEVFIEWADEHLADEEAKMMFEQFHAHRVDNLGALAKAIHKAEPYTVPEPVKAVDDIVCEILPEGWCDN